jgi:hypothetical protein
MLLGESEETGPQIARYLKNEEKISLNFLRFSYILKRGFIGVALVQALPLLPTDFFIIM